MGFNDRFLFINFFNMEFHTRAYGSRLLIQDCIYAYTSRLVITLQH